MPSRNFAHHVDDVRADRTDGGTAAAQGAAVVDQLLPLIELVVGHRLGQADHFFQPPQQGVFLLVDATQRLQLVDRRVLGVAGFRIEQAGFGTQAAVHAAVEVAGDGRVDDFLEDADCLFRGKQSYRHSFVSINLPLNQREPNTVKA